MNNSLLAYPLALYLANDAREREIRAAQRARLVQSMPRESVRRSLGRTIIKIGARLAGEPSRELARSR
jgi:hypothetical protein